MSDEATTISGTVQEIFDFYKENLGTEVANMTLAVCMVLQGSGIDEVVMDAGDDPVKELLSRQIIVTVEGSKTTIKFGQIH